MIKIGAEHPAAVAPHSLRPHQSDYEDQSWKSYTLEQLGSAVAFFVKRATQRAIPAKQAKDLYDAHNYLAMMQAHIDAHVADMGESVPRREKSNGIREALEKFL